MLLPYILQRRVLTTAGGLDILFISPTASQPLLYRYNWGVGGETGSGLC